MYKGKGLHHMGMGVEDQKTMMKFYQGTLQCTEMYEDFTANVWLAMPDMFRQNDHAFGGVIMDQKMHGIRVELIWLTVPRPRPIRKGGKLYGDLGVFKMQFAVGDVEKFYKDFKGKVDILSPPKSADIPGLGDYSFVLAKDPEGNLLEFGSWAGSGVKDGFGGSRWMSVSVTDLERSMTWYQKYCGWDTIVAEPHEKFSGLVDEASGASGTEVRSVLLANSRGEGQLELIEQLKPRGRSIPFNAYWGDYGYLEVCHDYGNEDLRDLSRWFEDEGMEYLHNPVNFGVAENYEIWFMYVKDPDGSPCEFLTEVPIK
jgi:catechol 2,3-dioxygenase-like lactoylglutathione lyase family enzyme